MINKKFQQEFNRLNPKQREAVETIEGPVMVVAGPGTGKTQILAMRIANILRTAQIDAGNILALTFTNSGVWAMKKRLLEIIGPASYRVHVHTYHSFCNEVIQTFPEKFLFSKKLDQISDLERLLLIRKIIDHHNFEKIKTLKAPYYYQNAISKSINDLKQENVGPIDFKKIVQKELKDLETINDLYHETGPNKGKIKAKYLDQKEQLLKNLELAEAYDQYQKGLKDQGLYDYADMILYVGNKLKKDHELLSYYQEKFQYILVDEYQDTNSGQNNVVKALASFYDQPNLFVVGDDEQSIFRFQGAALENILNFVTDYPQTKIIVLEDNYRSSQNILDASRAVIENNQNQIFNVLKIKKNLVSHSIEKSKINLAHFSNSVNEDFYIAQTIKRLIKKGIDPSEIACIYKEHRDAKNLSETLSKLNIPFTQNHAENILFDMEIQKIINLLRVVSDPYQDKKMFEVMHYEFLNLEVLDIFRLTHLAATKKQNLFEIVTSDAMPLKNKKTLKKLLDIILTSAKDFFDLTFAHAFEKIINDSGYLNYLLKLPDAPIRLNRLKSLFDEIKILNTKHKNLTLADFLTHLDQLSENNLAIKEELLDVNFQGVKLLTAHQSKGLEFEYVFILHLTDNHWGNKVTRELIKLPDGILKIQIRNDENNEEERRLFYVAFTRAKKQIYLTYADSYSESNKIQVASQFLNEIPTKFITNINVDTLEKSYLKRLKTNFSPPIFHPTKDLKDFLAQIAEKYILSATSLNAYLECPKKFLYNQFLRVPRVKDFNLAYGSAIHYGLELFFKKQIKDLALPTKKELIKFYDEGIEREILTESEVKRARHLGKKILEQYFDFYASDWKKKIPVAIEYNFGYHNVHFGPIPITGKIDKIEVIDKNAKKVKIIDYKTSQPKSLNFLLGRTKENDVSYLYQAMFYKLLAENDPLFDWKIEEVEFEFLSPQNGKFTKVSVPIEKKQYDEFLLRVGSVYKNIQELNFESNPSACKSNRFDCEYLNLCQAISNLKNTC